MPKISYVLLTVLLFVLLQTTAFSKTNFNNSNLQQRCSSGNFDVSNLEVEYKGRVFVENNKSDFDTRETEVSVFRIGCDKPINSTIAQKISPGEKIFNLKVPRNEPFRLVCKTKGFKPTCRGFHQSIFNLTFEDRYEQQPKSNFLPINEILRFAEQFGLTDDAIVLLKSLKIKGISSEQLDLINNAEKRIEEISISIYNLSEQEQNEQNQKWETIENIIQNSFSNDPLSEIQLSDAFVTAKNKNMPSGVREIASTILFTNKLPDKLKGDALEYFREEAGNSQSNILISSLTGLYILGKDSDRKLVTNRISSSDKILSTASLTALETALNSADTNRVNKIIEQFEDILKNDQIDLEFKENAFQSLGDFAKQNQSEKANKLLVNVLVEEEELQTITTIQSIPKEKLTQRQLDKVQNIEQRINSPN